MSCLYVSVNNLLDRCEIVRDEMGAPWAGEGGVLLLFIASRDRLLLSVTCLKRRPDGL